MPPVNRIVTRDVDFALATNDAQSDGRTLSGYAAVFGQDTVINSFEGNFVERLAPNCFKKTLQERKYPICQFAHGRDSRTGGVPIGVFTEMREDDHGLYVEARLFENDLVEPIRQAIEAQAISGMSFTFTVTRDEWMDNQGRSVGGNELQRLLWDSGDRGPLQRTIREVRLMEAGPVIYPAYEGTSVGVRSMDEITDEQRQAVVEEYRRTMVELESGAKTEAVVIPGGGGGQGGYATSTNQSFNKPSEIHFHVADVDKAVEAWTKTQREHAKGFELRDGPTDPPETALDSDTDGDDDTKDVDAEVDTYVDEDGVEHSYTNGVCMTHSPTMPDGRASDDKKPYGDVAYADPKNGKYPINSKAHVKAAWSYINMPKNQKGYTPEELSAIKSKIKAAAKKFGIDISDSESKSADVSAVENRDTLTDAINPEDCNAADEGTLRARESEQKETRADEAPVIVRKKPVTLNELRQRLAEIDARVAEITTEFRDAELPADVDTENTELRDERPKVEARIAAILQRMDELAEGEREGRTERSFSSAPTHARQLENIYDLAEIRKAAHGEDDYLQLVRDNASRAIERANYTRMVAKEDAQTSAQKLLDTVDDENATLAHRMLRTGSALYERAWSKTVAAGTPQMLSGEEYRALSLGTDGSGGYAVPFELDPTVILTSPGVINPLRSIARVEQIVGKEWMGVVSAGTSVTRSAEASEASDNSFTLTQPTVKTNRVAGFIPFSYELAESWSQVRSEITRALVDAKGREEATSFMLGDGTGNNASGILGTVGSGSYVAATPGQAFTASDVYHLEESLDPRWRNANAKFVAHRANYNKIRQFDQYGGAQLWQRIGAGMPAELLGYPALESSVMASTHATGDLFLLFGDFEQFLIVDRIGMSVELIPQVFGSNQRPTGQRGIYAIWMNNSQVLVPNAFRVLQGQA